MRIMVLGLLAMLLLPSVAAPAKAQSVCDQVKRAYDEVRPRPASAPVVIRRILGILTFSDDSRLRTNDERIGAIEVMVAKCVEIDRDQTRTPSEKDRIAKGWVAFIMTYRQESSLRGNGGIWLASVRWHDHAINTVSRSNPGRRVLIQSAPDLTAPRPPLRGAPILSVFPKKNLGQGEILRLRVLLADFDVRQGRSGLSGSRYDADVLFVHRDRVTQQDVIRVARALHEVGVDIKSVQQRSRGPAQFQVGTIAPAGVQAFATSSPLNLDMLASLQGDAFWTTAFNGTAWCDEGVERTVRCRIDRDGRPSRSPVRSPASRPPA